MEIHNYLKYSCTKIPNNFHEFFKYCYIMRINNNIDIPIVTLNHILIDENPDDIYKQKDILKNHIKYTNITEILIPKKLFNTVLHNSNYIHYIKNKTSYWDNNIENINYLKVKSVMFIPLNNYNMFIDTIQLTYKNICFNNYKESIKDETQYINSNELMLTDIIEVNDFVLCNLYGIDSYYVYINKINLYDYLLYKQKNKKVIIKNDDFFI